METSPGATSLLNKAAPEEIEMALEHVFQLYDTRFERKETRQYKPSLEGEEVALAPLLREVLFSLYKFPAPRAADRVGQLNDWMSTLAADKLLPKDRATHAMIMMVATFRNGNIPQDEVDYLINETKAGKEAFENDPALQGSQILRKYIQKDKS